ncbi:mammalian cell entry protein [Mycobacterium sp. 852002-50816_SCH5313054-b]|uniref:mammalian cell entry protein n=1 Tax=Mycobacterium sp. 852002-50816_SCH5313054-b TaxID=1834092 RepID=UPI0008013626|nr:mammalian cell entry protein [Mycobacterium sp. 852002-50816_SCH5313054-b]OBF60005.1 mammalian cell entry protein [Mycobacterium sp. 852002-50816_SCH5313054-b]
MEDQQPAAGDLTADAEKTGESSGEDAPETTESADGATESADVADAPAPDDEEAATDAKEKQPRRKILAGKRLAIAIALAAALFVGSAAFAGAAVQPYLADRATAATKLKVARTAANAITTLWTYTPENMDGLADRAAAYLSGDFAAQYRKFVDAIVGPNKQAKVTNSTEVVGAAVESLDDPNAVVIVYTNTTSTSPLTKNIPSLKYLSYRLFMKRTNGHWQVTRMTTITSLDLTPQV